MTGAMLYTQSFGSRPENVEVPHIDIRNPTSGDTSFPIGKRWVNSQSNTVFTLVAMTFQNLESSAIWASLTGSQIIAIGQATLVAGTVTVSNSACTPQSLIFLTYENFNGSLGVVYVDPASVGSGHFTITSTQSGDLSTFYYFIVN
jgi:hypothetical protein